MQTPDPETSSFDELLGCAADAGASTVIFEADPLARELIAYGEVEAADKLLQLDATELQAIGRRAYEIWSGSSGKQQPRLDKAICLASVEHVEGKARELKRRRRKEA